MSKYTLSGIYESSGGWPAANWNRLIVGHQNLRGEIPNLSLFVQGTYNVRLAAPWTPPNDDWHRQQAFNSAKQANQKFGGPNDFLLVGNYIHPSLVVYSVNDILILNGRVYYAGSTDYLDSANGIMIPGIPRNGLELISTDIIKLKTGTVHGQTVTVNLYEQYAPLVISQLATDPTSAQDANKEWVELVATEDINFTVRPMCVIVCRHTSTAATPQGWLAGGSITYGFNITSGTLNKGNVGYVGGSSMSPATNLRAITYSSTPGDRLGDPYPAKEGVFTESNAHAQGVAVFDMHIDNVTASTAPVDCLFWGNNMGNAVVNNGTAGYQMPYNDLYSPQFLQITSYLAPIPPRSNQVQATRGTYDAAQRKWTTPRTWATNTTGPGTLLAIL